MRNGRWLNCKISEEAKIAAQAIQQNFNPDMELQELYSLAIMEYLHAYYPDLEPQVAETIKHRQEARRERQAHRDAGADRRS